MSAAKKRKTDSKVTSRLPGMQLGPLACVGIVTVTVKLYTVSAE